MDDRDPTHWQEDEPARDAGNGEDSSDFDTADPQDWQEDEPAQGDVDREDGDDWVAPTTEAGRANGEADLDTDDAHGAPPNSEQHRWRRLLAVALAFAVVSWLVSAALVSFAFVTVVKQNDDHVNALTDLLEEGQAQRGSLLGSGQEQTEQRQAVLLNERAKTRASSAEARESRASREAALADAERSQSEATRAESQARSADVQGALAVAQQRMAEDQQRTDGLLAAAEARNEDAQATLAAAQAKLAKAQRRAADRAAGADAKLARAQAKLAKAQRQAAEAGARGRVQAGALARVPPGPPRRRHPDGSTSPDGSVAQERPAWVLTGGGGSAHAGEPGCDRPRARWTVPASVRERAKKQWSRGGVSGRQRVARLVNPPKWMMRVRSDS